MILPKPSAFPHWAWESSFARSHPYPTGEMGSNSQNLWNFPLDAGMELPWCPRALGGSGITGNAGREGGIFPSRKSWTCSILLNP